MGFLNETTDVVGSKLYSAARDRGDGNPVTDTLIMGPDGKTPISKTNPLAMELTGSNVQDVTLQDAVNAAGNGAVFTPSNGNVTLTIEIAGTSTSRTVIFELAGISGIYKAVTAFNVLDPSIMATQTTGGSDTSPESWQVEVPAGWSFRAKISAIAGGNVSIKGKAVA